MNFVKETSIFLVLIGISVSSCGEKNRKDPVVQSERVRTEQNDKPGLTAENEQNPETKQKADTNAKKPARQLKRYFYPNMSACGGAVYGFYEGESLVKINATYGAELGYSQRIVEFKNGQITQITYVQHVAEWEKYREKYPYEEFHEGEMTYTNRKFVIEFGLKNRYREYVNGQLVSKAIEEDLVNQLTECAYQMQSDLEREKVLK